MEGRWVLARSLSFPASKHQEKVFMNFFNGIFGHREAWCVNTSWVTSLFVIRHLGKFSLIFICSVNFTSDQPAPSLIFFQLQPGIKTLFFVLNICYEHTRYISMSLATVICECSLNQFSTSLFLSLFLHWHRKKWRIPILAYFRVFKEYPQKSQIWKSETSPNQGTWLGNPRLGLVWLCQIWDFYGYSFNTLKDPEMGIRYFFLCGSHNKYLWA